MKLKIRASVVPNLALFNMQMVKVTVSSSGCDPKAFRSGVFDNVVSREMDRFVYRRVVGEYV